MALTLDLDPQPTPKWTSDRRLCLTADGKVVDGSDPAGTTLLVCEGGQIDLTTAVAYGLATPDGTTIPPTTTEEKKTKVAAPKPPAKPTPNVPAPPGTKPQGD